LVPEIWNRGWLITIRVGYYFSCASFFFSFVRLLVSSFLPFLTFISFCYVFAGMSALRG